MRVAGPMAFLVLALSQLFVAHAAGEKPTEQKEKRNAPVLNFDADVIEGEKKGADLLLETESGKLDVGVVLYLRENFNDFHLTDRKQRPRIGTPPIGGKKR